MFSITKTDIEINDLVSEYVSKLSINAVKIADLLPENYAMNSVLEHVENPLEKLKMLYRILKPMGKIVFYVPNESCEKEYVRSEINNHLYTWNCLNLGISLKQRDILFIR